MYYKLCWTNQNLISSCMTSAFSLLLLWMESIWAQVVFHTVFKFHKQFWISSVRQLCRDGRRQAPVGELNVTDAKNLCYDATNKYTIFDVAHRTSGAQQAFAPVGVPRQRASAPAPSKVQHDNINNNSNTASQKPASSFNTYASSVPNLHTTYSQGGKIFCSDAHNLMSWAKVKAYSEGYSKITWECMNSVKKDSEWYVAKKSMKRILFSYCLSSSTKYVNQSMLCFQRMLMGYSLQSVEIVLFRSQGQQRFQVEKAKIVQLCQFVSFMSLSKVVKLVARDLFLKVYLYFFSAITT